MNEGYIMEAIRELKDDIKEIKNITKNIEISMVRSQDKLDYHDRTITAHTEEINCIKQDINKCCSSSCQLCFKCYGTKR